MLDRALLSLRPGAQWSLFGDTLADLVWHDTEQIQPTAEEIQAEIARLKENYVDKTYQIKRSREYPSIGDQLDALFHAGVFPADMAATIQAVKDKYPKS